MFKKREKKAKTISILENHDDEENNENDNQINEDNIFQEINTQNDKSISTDLLLHKDKLLSKKRGHFSTDSSKNDTVQSLIDDMKYKSSYALQNTNNSTRELEVDTEKDKDATSRRLRNEQISKDKLEGKIKDDQYMGKDATIVYAQKSERDLSRYKVTGSLGPMRAPSNLRVTCRFDYAYGICKDFKDTGYCGFGDNCVFMHDRSDYKTGWEVEEEYRKDQIRKQKLIMEGKSAEDNGSDSELNEEDSNSHIPLKCQICDEEYISPVFTKCLHYFCEACAMKHYAKTSLCFECRKPTQGIFNNAINIINKLKLRKTKGKSKMNNEKDKDKNAITTRLNEGEYSQGIEENSFVSNMEYLNKDNRRGKLETNNINFEEDEKDEFGFKNFKGTVNKKKKNKFKTQNELEFISDYKSY